MPTSEPAVVNRQTLRIKSYVHLFSIQESVDLEICHGHMADWVGTAVRAIPSRVGAGLIDLFLRYQRPRSGNLA